jgi:hypothetical protein
MTLEPIIQVNKYLIHEGRYPVEFLVKNDFTCVKSTITVLASYLSERREKTRVKWVFYFFKLPVHGGNQFLMSCFEKTEEPVFTELI